MPAKGCWLWLILLGEWSKIWWLSISDKHSFKQYSSYAQTFWSCTWWTKKCSLHSKVSEYYLSFLAQTSRSHCNCQCLSWGECISRRNRDPLQLTVVKLILHYTLEQTIFQMTSISTCKAEFDSKLSGKGADNMKTKTPSPVSHSSGHLSDNFKLSSRASIFRKSVYDLSWTTVTIAHTLVVWQETEWPSLSQDADLGGDPQLFPRTTCGRRFSLGNNYSLHLCLPLV